MKQLMAMLLAVTLAGPVAAGPPAGASAMAEAELASYIACLTSFRGGTRAAALAAEEACQWRLADAAERLRWHGLSGVDETIAQIKMAGAFARARYVANRSN